METKLCKVCGRELPLTAFKNTRWGHRVTICNACVKEKRAQIRYERSHIVGVKTPPVSDPDFDGRVPGDVWRQMCRAKKWLESRNCKITLYGDFIETKTKKLKFE